MEPTDEPDWHPPPPQPEPYEADWHPPPPHNDDWEKPWIRARQLLTLHGMVLIAAVLMFCSMLISPKMVCRFLLCESLGLVLCWVGLIAHLQVLGSERRSREVAEAGRMLVLGIDLFTVMAVVLGTCFWLAMFAL